MQAMLLTRLGELREGAAALDAGELPVPQPAAGEVLIEVSCCGVCHTELDEIEGRTPPPRLPVVPGHQVVGRVIGAPAGSALRTGQRVGVAWIFSACGRCEYCREGRENLCAQFVATGRDVHGGYAQFMTAPAEFVHPLPDELGDVEAAPLLCAGAVGYRALSLCRLEDGQALGLTGFGASGHLVLQMARARFPRSPIHVFTRNAAERALALDLGAAWAGAADAQTTTLLHAIIDTTPAWAPLRAALRNLRPGGRLVINAIRKEAADTALMADIDYSGELWLEKSVQSVANVTRADVRDCLALAARAGIRPKVRVYGLADANRALADLKFGRHAGAKVLQIAG
ncbi:alcohol dehydrogenase catalytic domain-containing protein [Immundisolibacter sp.]